MGNQIAKKMMCVQMRSGVEIWVEYDRAETLQNALEKITASKFVRFDGQTFNTADVVGVFSADTTADATRRKNGMWQCQSGSWHDKQQPCGCASREEKELIERRMNAIKECGKCTQGFVLEGNSAVMCGCQRGI